MDPHQVNQAQFPQLTYLKLIEKTLPFNTFSKSLYGIIINIIESNKSGRGVIVEQSEELELLALAEKESVEDFQNILEQLKLLISIKTIEESNIDNLLNLYHKVDFEYVMGVLDDFQKKNKEKFTKYEQGIYLLGLK